MRNIRAALAAATTFSLLAALTSGPATAAATGVGTSSAETTVVGVDLGANGSLLAVRLLRDSARGTIDPKVTSAAEAFSRITGLSVDSSVDALDKSSGRLESKDPGGEKQVTQGSVNLTKPAPGVTLDPAIVSGTIGLTSLSSNATATKSASTIAASLTNAVVGGALATVEGVSSTLAATATNTTSETSRSVEVDQAVVLDLGALLEGLGLSILDLPLDTVSALLDELDLDVGDVANDAVQAAIDDLQAEIDALETQLLAATPALPTGGVSGVIGLINDLDIVTVPTSTETAITALPTVTDQLDALIDELQNVLATLLTQVALELDTAPLLSVSALEATVATKAGDTVAGSSTSRSAKIGSITVGGVTIPGTDLLKTADQVDATVATVDAALGGALGAIAGDLDDLVTVKLFERVAGAGVSSADGYVKAVDGLTVLRATVTPPSTLTTIVDGIVAAAGLDQAIADAGGTPPQLDGTMADLSSALGGARSLGSGGGVGIAQVLGTSEFAAASSGTGTDTDTGTGSGRPGEDDRSLPATGRNSTLPMTAFAMLLIALGLGFRHWTHMPVQAIRVRIRTR